MKVKYIYDSATVLYLSHDIPTIHCSNRTVKSFTQLFNMHSVMTIFSKNLKATIEFLVVWLVELHNRLFRDTFIVRGITITFSTLQKWSLLGLSRLQTKKLIKLNKPVFPKNGKSNEIRVKTFFLGKIQNKICKIFQL